MKRNALLTFAIVLAASCHLCPAQDLNVREFRRLVDSRNVTTTDVLPWYAGESVGYTILARRGTNVVEIPEGVLPVWTVIDAQTNAYVVSTGSVVSASNGEVRFWLPSPLANLPAGNYLSFATAYQGTNRVGVLDRASVSVAWRPGDDFSAVEPFTNVIDQVIFWLAEANANLASLSNLLSEADATVQSNLTAHADRADNPHGVTAAQIGAATTDDVAEAVADYLPLAAGNSVVEGAGGATISFADEKITGMSLKNAASVDAYSGTFYVLKMGPWGTSRWVRADGGTNEMYFDAFNHQWFYSKGVKSFGIRSNGDVQVEQNLTVGQNVDAGNRIAVGVEGTVLTNGGLNFSGTDAPSISVADRPWIKPGVDGTNTMLYGGVKVESNLTVTSTAPVSHQLDLNGLDYIAADGDDHDTLLIGNGADGYSGRIGLWSDSANDSVFLRPKGTGFAVPSLQVEGDLRTIGRQTPYVLTYAPTTTLSSAGNWIQALSCSDSQPVVIRPSTGNTGYVEQITLYLKLGTNSCTLTGFTGDVPVMTTGTVNTVLFRSPYFSTNWYVEILE